MHETIIKKPKVLARFLEGPHLKERECFLRQCAAEGYSLSMLRKIAWILLSISPNLDFCHGKITKSDLEQAIDGRVYFIKSSKHKHGSRQMFIRFATKWIRNLGLFEDFVKEKNSFDIYISEFSRYLSDERGLSPVTISTRCERLSWFFDYLNSRIDSLCSITIADIDDFIKEKGNNGWKRSSLASLASDLRSFFRYAGGQCWCDPKIADVIESPRIYTREGLPEGPAWEDVKRLLNDERNCPADVRNNAILMLLAIYGFRRAEVAGLQLDDIDWVGEKIRISRPKQRKVQYYPLVMEIGESILLYLREVRPRCSHRDLFLSLAAPIRPLSPHSITAIVHSRLRAIGINLTRQGAHCLRHSCARHLLDSGFSLKEIGDHLGHRSVNSTLNYTKIDISSLRQVAEFDLRGLL
jgi:site-specific recombinase XerD